MEIIIVDDGSSDNTREVLIPYLNLHSKIRYIYQDNRGTASARNTGIKSSSGDYIAFLDHDDIWLPQKTESQVGILERNPSLGLVYCNFYILDEEKGSVVDSPNRGCCRGKVYDKFLFRNYITTASQIMVRRECLGKIGYFNESLFGVDDYDFYIRASRYYEIEYIDQPLVKWRTHPLNTSKGIGKMEQNRIAMKEQILKQEELSSQQRVILKQGLRKDYFQMGYYYLDSHELKRGRSYFLKSLGYKSPLSCIYIMSSYLPTPIFKVIRNFKRRLSKYGHKLIPV